MAQLRGIMLCCAGSLQFWVLTGSTANLDNCCLLTGPEHDDHFNNPFSLCPTRVPEIVVRIAEKCSTRCESLIITQPTNLPQTHSDCYNNNILLTISHMFWFKMATIRYTQKHKSNRLLFVFRTQNNSINCLHQ